MDTLLFGLRPRRREPREDEEPGLAMCLGRTHSWQETRDRWVVPPANPASSGDADNGKGRTQRSPEQIVLPPLQPVGHELAPPASKLAGEEDHITLNMCITGFEASIERCTESAPPIFPGVQD